MPGTPLKPNSLLAYLPVLSFPVASPYLASQQLTAAVLGQLVNEVDRGRLLVPGEMLPAGVYHALWAKFTAAFQGDHGGDRFAPSFVRRTNDDYFIHLREGADHPFDFSGVNVKAARDDDVTFAVDDVEVPADGLT